MADYADDLLIEPQSAALAYIERGQVCGACTTNADRYELEDAVNGVIALRTALAFDEAEFDRRWDRVETVQYRLAAQHVRARCTDYYPVFVGRV